MKRWQPGQLHRSSPLVAAALIWLLCAQVTARAFSFPPDSAISTCSPAAREPSLKAAVSLEVGEDVSCLVEPSALDSSSAAIFDLRSRGDFLSFHIPGADHASASALITMPRASGKQLIVYDSGKFRSDAFLLCSRLRKAGLTNVRVLNGGIASWAQNQNHPSRFDLSRLSNREIAAVLSVSTTRAEGMTEPLKLVIQRSPIKPMRLRGPKTDRIILLADSAIPFTKIQSALDRQPATAFYWLGSADQLSDLLTRHAAQNEKRLAGPAESPVCSAL